MATSEWTRPVRAVRDTPVADYSAPGINSMRRVAYRPLITVSPFLLALSISYFKRKLWRHGQLWPYVRMGPLGTSLHWNRNAMGDTAKISPRFPSTCTPNGILSSLNIHIIPSHQMYAAIDNPSLVPSVSCLSTPSYLRNYVHAADDVSHGDNLQSHSYWCSAHMFTLRDGIQSTQVFRYCGERHW